MTTYTVQCGQTISDLIHSLLKIGHAEQTIQLQAILPNGEAWNCPLTIAEIPNSNGNKGLPRVVIQMRLCDLPCGECMGAGVTDTGGFTENGTSIDVPCAMCDGTGKVQ